MILNTIETIDGKDTPQVRKLLSFLYNSHSAQNRNELQKALNLKDRKSFRERYIKSAFEAGLIEMTIPDKPNSRLQQYQLTEQGRKVAEALK